MGRISTFRSTSGFVAERVLTKDRANARRRNKTATAQPAEELAEEDEWDSEANDYESSVPDTAVTEVEDDDPPQDTPADERERYVDFDGPFAVIPIDHVTELTKLLISCEREEVDSITCVITHERGEYAPEVQEAAQVILIDQVTELTKLLTSCEREEVDSITCVITHERGEYAPEVQEAAQVILIDQVTEFDKLRARGGGLYHLGENAPEVQGTAQVIPIDQVTELTKLLTSCEREEVDSSTCTIVYERGSVYNT
ncbi:hypothetical protein N7486_004192 [Penicillium sp. IBT 16267x]|nr:hypothetical protein N7486_004192 [Penicillium sp. IBT 16267x]